MHSVFQCGHVYLWKNREIYSWIKICTSKKVEKTFKILINDLFCFGLFSVNLLNLKTDIIGSYTSEKISNRIDCPKYLDKNQALFRHKSQMIAELYLVCILGIQANWENRKTNTPNNLGYTENISKSPTPHSASDKVFRLIFIQPFYAINLIWWSIF